MPLPNINIAFKTVATAAVQRAQKGVVAIIIKDSKSNGALTLTDASQIPATLGKGNQDYIRRAFMGYVTPPRKVLCYVLPSAAADLSAATDWLATQNFDYLAGPPDIAEAECTALVDWVKACRKDSNAIYKVVLPDTGADSEAVVNFSASGIKAGSETLTGGQYASRIAGLIAGTPMSISCTYAPLPELSDITRQKKAEMDAAVDAGKLILLYDGEKVKVARGVNSLTTTTMDKGPAFQKIKIVEAVDMIQSDIRRTAQDSWIGKYPNNYDSKCLLITAIGGYFTELEMAGILQRGRSAVEIDLAAQMAYLRSQGVDISKMTEQEIKEADTGSKVFLSANINILDAIEDIDLNITI